LAEKIRPERPGLPSLGGLLPPAPTRPGPEIGRELPPSGAPRRWRERIPTPAQLQALIKNGRLVLPLRYFRGYFLDLFA
jgi:hypothetical protein